MSQPVPARLLHFQRLTRQPLLGPEAVPWAGPTRVVKGYQTSTSRPEVRRTIVHPSVLDLRALLPDAPARFVMYYAPHHSSGIGAALADDLLGPWRPLEANPILTLARFRGFRGHISAPDVIWLPQERRFRLYFHGSTTRGQQTGLALSTDGLRFEPVSPDPILPYPYLRLFRRPDAFYGIVRLDDNLGLVRSTDGISWQDWPRNPLLATGDEHQEYDRLRHYAVWVEADVLYLYYCTYVRPDESVEAIKLATIDLTGDWRDWPHPERRGVVLAPELEWECDNLRDPFLIEVEGRLYMFYVGGNEAGISLARAAD